MTYRRLKENSVINQEYLLMKPFRVSLNCFDEISLSRKSGSNLTSGDESDIFYSIGTNENECESLSMEKSFSLNTITYNSDEYDKYLVRLFNQAKSEAELFDVLARMLESSKFCDLIIDNKSYEFLAHRAVLALESQKYK